MHRMASYLAEPSLRGLIMQNLARTQHHQNQRICTHIIRTKSYRQQVYPQTPSWWWNLGINLRHSTHVRISIRLWWNILLRSTIRTMMYKLTAGGLRAMGLVDNHMARFSLPLIWGRLPSHRPRYTGTLSN